MESILTTDLHVLWIIKVPIFGLLDAIDNPGFQIE